MIDFRNILRTGKSCRIRKLDFRGSADSLKPTKTSIKVIETVGEGY
ncbi:hypothetical protein [Azospirillum doebereinerae]